MSTGVQQQEVAGTPILIFVFKADWTEVPL